MRTQANDDLLYREAHLSQEEVAALSPRAYDALVTELRRIADRYVAEGKLAPPGTPCHHCGEPIHGDAVSFHGENAAHYHARHAHHHKTQACAIFHGPRMKAPMKAEEAAWRGEAELSDEAVTPEQRAAYEAERQRKRTARARRRTRQRG